MTDKRLDQILKQALAPEIDDAEIRISKKARVSRMNNVKKTGNRNFPMAAAIALMILCLAGGSVYAAGRYFGLLDFTGHLREDIPEGASNLIEKEIDQSVEVNSEEAIINCAVKEALCDSETIMIVYEVSAKETGKYLFIPEDAVADDDMSGWSDMTGITADEYADKNGLTIINIGGGIANTDELGIIASSMSFRSVADDIMDIYVRSGKQSDAKNFDVTCVATAWTPGTNSVMRKEIKFTLEDMSQAVVYEYTPQEQSDEKTVCVITGAEVIQTELQTYVDIHYYNMRESMSEGVTFRLKDSDGNKLDYIEGSGVEFADDGSRSERFILNKTQLGDCFVIEVYDYYEDVVYETLWMELK